MSKKYEVIQTVHDRDERGAFTKYIYSDGNEYTVRAFVHDLASAQEIKKAKAYSEHSALQAVPFEKHLADNNVSLSEWYRAHEEAALSKFYGCEVKTKIHDKADI